MNIWLHESIRLKKATKVVVNSILRTVVYRDMIPQVIRRTD
jgi:hypothetical protein